MLVSHIMACGWVFAAQVNPAIDMQDTNWVKKFGHENETNFQLYTDALYFSITTMATVGYGDINGSNTIEKYVCLCMMIFGVAFFSIINSSIASIMV